MGGAVYHPIGPAPKIKSARSGKTAFSTRVRRMQDLATSPDPENLMSYDANAILSLPGDMITLRTPDYAGEEYFLWLNTDLGAGWVVDCGPLVEEVTFSEPGHWILLKAITISNVLQWALIAYADGITFTGTGGGMPPPPPPP